MTETNERDEGAGGGRQGATEEAEGRRREDEGELRAEEESAKAMEAEVPHPEGYPEPGQEPPEAEGQKQSS